MSEGIEVTICNFDTFILDSSVIINLHCSNFGQQMIQSLPGTLVVTQAVNEELCSLKSQVHGTSDFLNQVLNFDNVIKVGFKPVEDKFHGKLQDFKHKPKIDAGEASVIAVSKYGFSGENCIPIIDDRRGRIAAEKYLSGKECGYSLNLFFHPNVLSELGKENASDAVYNALLNSQMSIPKNCVQQVIDFIGIDRARECVSLPGYKNLFS